MKLKSFLIGRAKEKFSNTRGDAVQPDTGGGVVLTRKYEQAITLGSGSILHLSRRLRRTEGKERRAP